MFILTWDMPTLKACLFKAQLGTKIADIIRQRGLTQERAAKSLRLTHRRSQDCSRDNFVEFQSDTCWVA